jgi:hypothetical protein
MSINLYGRFQSSRGYLFIGGIRGMQFNMLRITNILIFILILILAGCFYIGQDRYEDIIKTPSYDWSIREGMTVILEPIAHNLYDLGSPNVKVYAAPYFPSVVLAIERAEQRVKHWNEDEYRKNVDKLLKESVGLYRDWEKEKFVDGRGNYYKEHTQIDSMLILITIENRGWPCNVPLITVGIPGKGMADGAGIYWQRPLAQLADWPCYMPDITTLEDRIFLVNGKDKFIKPRVVWGKRNNILTMPETMFAMFHFREGNYHFLDGSDKMYLVIKGFENDIKLSFPISMMR